MRQHKWVFRLVGILLILSLIFTEVSVLNVPVYAKKKTEKESDKKDDTKKDDTEDEELTPEELAEKQLKEEKKARKKIPIETNSIEDWPQGPKTYCESGILMDLDSGAVLYSKNADAELYPASITKVLTALVALENCELDEKVTFSQASIDILGNGYANIGMKVGEKISMEDALYAMMLASANEVAYAICEHFGGGDYETGVAMLNAKAAELGCTDTNFVNPNGIFDENHHTTTHDMALIAQAAYKYDIFQKIINTKQYTIKKTKKTDEARTFQNHHKMLWSSSDYYYEYCTGGKTGYTSESLNTLVTYAEKDGRRLLCVTMKTRGGDTYTDTAKILDYGFDNFQTLGISQNETASVFTQICDGTYVTIPADADFQDLVYTTASASDTNISLNYTFNGYSVGTGVARVDAADSDDVELGESFDSGSSTPQGALQKRLSSLLHSLRHIKENVRKEYVIAGVGGLIVLLILIRLIVSSRKRAKARKKRRKGRRRNRS